MNRRFPITTSAAFAVSSLAFVSPAHAYIGPGAGLGAIGLALALLVVVVLLIVGFLWFPIKRALNARRDAKAAGTQSDENP
ncbi:hypothetical protein [Ruegeria sp. HKCCD7318]|uniref:hypothetical protein n=1 Tax=Ruegeria sp. HKCCD7318 TaxID=2683014 RepID=UPI001C11486B|nr:hypothetical protein [Ruegeria sp. HKCCD7318]